MPRSSPARDRRSFRTFVEWCRSHAALCFAVLSVVWVAFLYRHAPAGEFVYDDIDQIQHNVALSSWPALGRYFVTVDHFSASLRGVGGAFYRPLFWASL